MTTISGPSIGVKPRELKFKTPYGYIAALEWGDRNAPEKIFCSHGWLDNAGSFECLIPHLLADDNCKRFHVVAIDFPGVGLSSHYPAGSLYTTPGAILEMKRVIVQLKWDKYTMLSHSLGSHMTFLYSCIYRDEVLNMVSIDLAYPLTRPAHNWNLGIQNSIDDHFRCEYNYKDDPTTNIKVPVYNEMDAIKRLMDGHSSSLTEDSSRVLLKRGATKQRWGYTFNRDLRLRYMSIELRPDDALMLQYMKPFKANLLNITALRSPYKRPESILGEFRELFRKNCPKYEEVELDGTHHLHMNSPEIVAPEIIKFLNSVSSINSLGKSNL